MLRDLLNENTPERFFDEASREHTRLLSSLKNSSLDTKAELAIQKELVIVQGLAAAIIKLRNFRKKLAELKARE